MVDWFHGWFVGSLTSSNRLQWQEAGGWEGGRAASGPATSEQIAVRASSVARLAEVCALRALSLVCYRFSGGF